MYRPTHIAAIPPTVNDDFSTGFRQGNYWWDSVTKTEYILEDEATGTAVWTSVNTGTSYEWKDWSPTFTWTPAIASGISYVARYYQVGTHVGFYLDISATNSTGSPITAVSAVLPLLPIDVDAVLPCSGLIHPSSKTTYPTTAILSYIDQQSPSDTARKVYSGTFSVAHLADFRVFISGFYETT